MENQEKFKGLEQILIKASKMILKMSQKSLDTIAKRKMYHTKLIERSSRCTKDPNPLATTMILLNQKYPLALSTPEAKKYGIPRHLIASNTNSKQTEDTHRHNHVLARLETLNWWIEQSSPPNEQLVRLADVLFSGLDEATDKYYQSDWSKARIKWGPPMLQRNLVRTHKPLVDIPSHLRNSAVKEIFFPDFTIPNPSLPTGIVNELRDKINMRIEDHIPLSKQIRIIINSLDPRERYLPILPSSDESAVQMKHALIHNNLVVVNYISSSTSDSPSWIPMFKNMLSCIIYEGKIANIPVGELKEICLRSSILEMPFLTMLDSVSVGEAIEFLWARALFNRPTTLEYKRGPMTICPDPREGREVMVYNKKSISRVIKMGNQIVNFKYNELRGKFAYNGQSLIEVVCNFTTIRDFMALLKEIAKYINYRYQDTTEIRASLNDRQIEKIVEKGPYRLIGCTLLQYSTISDLSDGENCGKYRYQPNSEYLITGCYTPELDDHLNVSLPGTALKIVVDPNRNELKPFPEGVLCKSHLLLRHFNVKETIKEMFYYYLANINTVQEKVTNRDFIWKNHYLNKFLGVSGRQMSLMARLMIAKLVESSHPNSQYICFLYCFCNQDPRGAAVGNFTYSLPNGTVIDLSGERGIFFYSEEHNSYLLYGLKVGKRLSKIGKAELMNGILEGYRIKHPAKEGIKISTVRYLESNLHNIEEGTNHNVFIGGVLYTAIKDSSISHAMRSTMIRHMDEIIKRVEKQGKSVILGKRWLDCEEFDSEHLSPERKKRKKEEEEISIEYSEDIVLGHSIYDVEPDEECFDSEEDI